MGKGSLAKISAALAIISLYVYLFGIMGTVESLDESIPEEQRKPVETVSTTAPVSETTTAPEVMLTERAVYTYATQLNVVNGKKPGLNDYTATEAMLLVTEEPAAAISKAAKSTNDFEMEADDFDYTTPLRTTQITNTTTPPETTATAQTTAVTTNTTTTAAPVLAQTFAQTPVPETTTTSETTTLPPETTTSETTTLPPEMTTTTTTTEETTTTTTAEETVAVTDPPLWGEEATTTTVQETAPSDVGTLSVYADGQVVSGDAVSIVARAVMGEISDVFDEEAIKAQAVATYTYIKYYNDNGRNAYAVLSTPTDKVTNCVSQVIGKALYYNGTMIQAVYCASSAGYTASAINVWGVNYPYLMSRRTDFDELYDINYGRKATFTADEMRSYVLRNTGIVLNDDPSSWFSITSRVDGNYVGGMTIGGLSYYTKGGKTVEITGRIMREVIMEFDLRSASFDISYDPASATFTFTTYGYGHGCGMSQHGANILAKYYGYTYDQILAFYYPGTTVA